MREKGGRGGHEGRMEGGAATTRAVAASERG